MRARDERLSVPYRIARLGAGGSLSTDSVVEPTKKQLGDGDVLSDQEADYEVRPEWCLAPKKTVDEA